MIIGDRLRALREQKKLSQGEIEKRTGLLRCYISRVENGHTVPAVETLEKFARALEVPVYQLFYDGEEPPKLPDLPKRKGAREHRVGQFRPERSSAGEVLPSVGSCERERSAIAVFHGSKDGEVEDELIGGSQTERALWLRRLPADEHHRREPHSGAGEAAPHN